MALPTETLALETLMSRLEKAEALKVALIAAWIVMSPAATPVPLVSMRPAVPPGTMTEPVSERMRMCASSVAPAPDVTIEVPAETSPLEAVISMSSPAWI